MFGPIAGKVTRYQPGKEVAPGITTLTTAGHTLGHSGFIIASGNQSLMHLVDAATHPAVWLRHPGWPYPGDVDKPLGIETRKRLLDRVAADKVMIQAMHFPFPGNGYVVKDRAAYRVLRPWNHLL